MKSLNALKLQLRRDKLTTPRTVQPLFFSSRSRITTASISSRSPEDSKEYIQPKMLKMFNKVKLIFPFAIVASPLVCFGIQLKRESDDRKEMHELAKNEPECKKFLEDCKNTFKANDVLGDPSKLEKYYYCLKLNKSMDAILDRRLRGLPVRPDPSNPYHDTGDDDRLLPPYKPTLWEKFWYR